jgi:hypothetical protein
LSARGYDRGDLLLAWDFKVASKRSVLGPIMSMREQTLEILGEEEIEYEITRIEDDPRPETLRVIEGNFFAPTFLKSDRDLDLTDEDEAVLQPERLSVPFTMIIPRAALEGEPLPLTVFGHGLFGVGREYLAGGTGDIIQPLANEYGTVMIATNWSGLSGADFDRIVTELVPNLNNIGVVTDRLAQSLINNVVMTRLGRDVLGQDEEVWDEDHALIDVDRTWYYGVSLGGIQGGLVHGDLSRHPTGDPERPGVHVDDDVDALDPLERAAGLVRRGLPRPAVAADRVRDVADAL